MTAFPKGLSGIAARTQAVLRGEIRSGHDLPVVFHYKRVDSGRNGDFQPLRGSCGEERRCEGVAHRTGRVHDRDGSTFFTRGDRSRENDMADLVLPHPPFTQIRARGRNRNVRQIQSGENSPLFERRRDGDPVKIIRGVASNDADVPSEIQNRVGVSGFYEEFRRFLREEAFSNGSKIEFHTRLEHDVPSFHSHVFKIRSRRGIGNFRHEIPAFEIAGVADERDVPQRVEIARGPTVTFARNGKEFEKLVGNRKPAHAVQDG